MKFSLSSSELAERLQAIGKVINTKNQMSILDCFLFEVSGDTLKITASDNENTLVTTLKINEAGEDFRFAINAKTVLDAVKGIPEQPVTFNVDMQNFNTTVNYQNGHFSLVSQNADEYPSYTDFPEDSAEIKVDSKLLLDSVGRALFATAPTDSAHPVMSGVLFDITQKDETNNEGANVSIVASDGRKLEYTRWANENNVQAGQYVLSNKPALLLRSLLARESGEITMRFAKEKAEVRMNTFSMTCRLIDGKFPAYNKVVPKNNPNRLTVNRMAFINMLRRVLVFSDAVSSLVKLHMEADQLVTSVQNIDYSLSAEESMICEYDGMPMNIGFKGTTLVDFLNNIECENIEFQIADQSRAVIIVPSPQPNAVKDDDGNAKSKEEIVMLLMPSIIND
ncbi:MAG: DNA polymerase III subunit beta [Prevotellaceae bacterium]|nr:DNA polymerase III subunit beta [Prevotellaceae bacterium]MDY4759898.1 DNA polymerase III subunit beta [Bacteroidaceae bacterium]